jgi:hypothetical protein
MKTAMQDLIEYVESNEIVYNKDLILKLKELLYKERKQITDACWYGHDIKHEYFNPIHYFEQTYNQNK